jgi:hypothetical protein
VFNVSFFFFYVNRFTQEDPLYNLLFGGDDLNKIIEKVLHDAF